MYESVVGKINYFNFCKNKKLLFSIINPGIILPSSFAFSFLPAPFLSIAFLPTLM